MSPNPSDKPQEFNAIPDSTSALMCRICGKPVLVEAAKDDGDGKPIHEECYAVQVQLEHAGNGVQDGKASVATTRPWKVIAAEAKAEQDPQKLSKLVHELNQALKEQGLDGKSKANR